MPKPSDFATRIGASAPKHRKTIPKVSKKTAKSLNIRQLRFVEEYLKDQNGTRSAIAAGYSKRTAHVQATALLKHPKIIDTLQNATDKAAKKADISADWIIDRLKEEATDHSDHASQSGRVQALSLLGKTLAMFSDRIVSDTQITVNIVDKYAQIQVTDGKLTRSIAGAVESLPVRTGTHNE